MQAHTLNTKGVVMVPVEVRGHLATVCSLLSTRDWDWTQGIRQGGKRLYPPRQLISLPFATLIQAWIPCLRNAVAHSRQIFPHQLTRISELLRDILTGHPNPDRPQLRLSSLVMQVLTNDS